MHPTDTHGPEGSLSILSAILTVFAWLSLKDVQVLLSIIATIVAIVSGCFACYLYYLKIKSKSYKNE